MKKILLILSLLGSFKASACALQTYYWPIPLGYKEGAVDLNSIVKRQVSWDKQSDINLDVNPSIKNFRANIEEIVRHYKYINYFPEHIKNLELKNHKLMSFRVAPIGGNSFLGEGGLEGSVGYFLPEVDLGFEELEKIWLIILEYQFVFSWPNGKNSFSYKIEIYTLPDGTILYEYPGMGYCES